MDRRAGSSRRLRLALALTLGLLVLAPTASGAGTATRCRGAGQSAASAPLSLMRSAVLCLVNRQRVAHHLPVLHPARRLGRAAQFWTAVMVRTARFTHGVDFSGRITATGYDWSYVGENIAAGFETPRQVVHAWMASLDHCHNILDPNYADVGTGVSSIPFGQYGPSTWTQDFGLWMGRRPPSHDFAPSRGCPYNV